FKAKSTSRARGARASARSPKKVSVAAATTPPPASTRSAWVSSSSVIAFPASSALRAAHELRLHFRVGLHDLGSLLGAHRVEPPGEDSVARGQDGGREKARVATRSDTHRGDKNAAKHLHRRKKRVHAAERSDGDRHGDDRKRRVRREHT